MNVDNRNHLTNRSRIDNKRSRSRGIQVKLNDFIRRIDNRIRNRSGNQPDHNKRDRDGRSSQDLINCEAISGVRAFVVFAFVILSKQV